VSRKGRLEQGTLTYVQLDHTHTHTNAHTHTHALLRSDRYVEVSRNSLSFILQQKRIS